MDMHDGTHREWAYFSPHISHNAAPYTRLAADADTEEYLQQLDQDYETMATTSLFIRALRLQPRRFFPETVKWVNTMLYLYLGIRQQDVFTDADPLQPLADYIFSHSVASWALFGDNDIKQLLEDLRPHEDLRRLLKRLRPRVRVDGSLGVLLGTFIVLCAVQLNQLPMHRALHISEVVEMICAQIPLQDHWGSPDLARLARTSQLFRDPALNALWRQQGTIVNLLKVMPVGLWDIREDHDATAKFGSLHLDAALLRPVIPSDWERFALYARRVRSFRNHERFKTPEAYETLAQHGAHQPVFPFLKKLKWVPRTTGHFGHVRLFITPTITDLHLTIRALSDISILATVALVCRRLTALVIDHTPEGAVPPISECVRALHYLESLTVVGLDRAAFCHIAQLPNLRFLWLMSSTSPIPFGPILSGSPAFLALQELKFETIQNAPALLASFVKCSPRALTVVGRSFQIPPTQSVSKEFYTALAKHCTHSSLQDLELQGGHYHPTLNAGQLDVYSVGGGTLEPLLVFRNLVVLRLSHAAGFDLDNAMVGKMASAWPHIEILDLTWDPSCYRTSRVTLEGISAFATHCSKLEELTIAFDATSVPEVNGTAHQSLKELSVGHSSICVPRVVAEFLHAVFPGLQILRTVYDEVDHTGDCVV
ncbi:hypothetical protein C8R46DRAFT_1355758 [Mycena filopes]|nr:hypothetical protein C8R46DRAFT_1355758 [Mycena filopes]